MSKTITVSPEIAEKTPEVLRNLPTGKYRLTKLGTLDNPKWGESSINKGRPYIGNLSIIDRSGGPSVMIGNFPNGKETMLTSWVLDAWAPESEDEAESIEGYLDDTTTESKYLLLLKTENSRYLLEGPVYSSAAKQAILQEVFQERLRQDAKFGEQNPPDGTGGPGRSDDANQARRFCDESFKNGTGTWAAILGEEVAEALAESDPDKLRTELIQIAAVASAWAEAIDRR